jgi:hypothetical protein
MVIFRSQHSIAGRAGPGSSGRLMDRSVEPNLRRKRMSSGVSKL